MGGEAAAWRAEFGRRWRLELLILACLLTAGGALVPLLDPDLPMHLAMGEWILRHRAVPFVEPFAWTRAGAPYFAYSWAPEVTYAIVYRAAGALGLRLLHAVLLTSAGAAMLALARAARWSPWTGVLLALGNVAIALVLASFLRPQLVLFVTVPLAWALAYRVLGAARLQPLPVLGIVVTSAITANSHLLFPLTAAPWLLLVTQRRLDWRRAAALVGGTVAGWLLSPYALAWPDVFRLNFAPNPLFAYPSPVSELVPGVQASIGSPVLLLALVALALLPWALAGAPLTGRERAAYAAAWLAGLLAFAAAVRALLVWWLLVLPAVAEAVERLARVPKRRAVRLAQKSAVYVLVLLVVAGRAVSAYRSRAKEPVAGPRPLRLAASRQIDPIAAWLECHTRPRSGGRVFTVFGLGTYLTWRLPAYSSSIDGRNIFPDSVAKAEAYHLPWGEPLRLGPWASADVAIVPFNYPVAAVLDTARGWRRVALTDTTGTNPKQRIGLWVRDAWWQHAGAAPPPPAPVLLSATSGRAAWCSRLGASAGAGASVRFRNGTSHSRTVAHPRDSVGTS